MIKDDGFVFVKRKGKRHTKLPKTDNIAGEAQEFDCQKFKTKIILCINEIKSSEFYGTFLDSLKRSLALLCGNGNFKNARGADAQGDDVFDKTKSTNFVIGCTDPPRTEVPDRIQENCGRERQQKTTDENIRSSCSLTSPKKNITPGFNEDKLHTTECQVQAAEVGVHNDNLSLSESELSEAKRIEHESFENESSSPKSLLRNKPIKEVVCYGLGNFTACVIARYQLALLWILVEHLQVRLCNCHLYDPRFTEAEKQFLQDSGMNVIPINEECRRPCKQQTVFYMPHCDKPLYNNLVHSNWSTDLTNLVIIGNSFNNTVHNLPRRILESEAFYINKILPYAKEVSIVNNFCFTDIFNDTSIHCFPEACLGRVPEGFWDTSNP